MLEKSDELRERLHANARLLSRPHARLGFELIPGEHPIIPVMLGDAPLAGRLAERLLSEGIYVVGFLLSGRAARQGAHPHANERRSFHGAIGARGRGLRARRPRARHHPLEVRNESTGQGSRGTRHLAPGRSGARSRPQRRVDQDASDGDLRHRHAHLQLGCLGAEDDPRADDRRPRVFRGNRRSRQRSARLRARRPRLRRRAHHLRTLPQLPRRAAPSVPQYAGRRRQSRRRLRRIPDDTGLQRLQAAARDRRRDRLDPRSARQRDAHGALVRRRRRGRADHRRRPDRHHGGRDRAPLRRAPCRHHRRQRLPPGPRRGDGRFARAERLARNAG